MNYSILDNNVLRSLDGATDGCEIAPIAYLWARERLKNDTHGYQAESFAREASRLNAGLSDFIGTALSLGAHDDFGFNYEKAHDLKNFILDRHAAMRFPGEKRSYTNRFDLEPAQ